MAATTSVVPEIRASVCSNRVRGAPNRGALCA